MRKFLTYLTLSLIITMVFSSCVTRQVGPFDDKKDLNKAAQTYIQIGYSYFEQGSLYQSKQALTKAIDIDDRLSGAHLGLARVYDTELEHKLANDHFKKAIQYGGGTESHYQYGAYLYNQKEFKSAYKQFGKVLENTIYEKRAQAFEHHAFTARRIGKDDVAISSFERAIALNKLMANSYIGLTNIFYERGELAVAYNHFQDFVGLVQKKSSRHNASSLFLGIQLADLNNDQDAVYSYVLQLKNNFSKSTEYKQYLKWKKEKDAA